ncbi:hypothetical protein AN958_06297 [Leucoagaricus sp. SymC.cos]|nr:hypothetical protein AN958_06297 [Leucoagaricus sp. SymC.cos]
MRSMHHGENSFRISFPALSHSAQLSAEEVKELEHAIAQMERLNALVSVPSLTQEVSFIKEQLTTSQGSCRRSNPTQAGSKFLVTAPFVNSAQKKLALDETVKKTQVDELSDLCAVGPRVVRQFAPKVTEYPENSCHEHVLHWEMYPYYDFEKNFSVYIDPASKTKSLVKPFCDQVCQPLRPAKKERFPFLDLRKPPKPRSKQPITPKKENLNRPPFKVRRKPVPKLSDLPSSPSPAPRLPKDAIRGRIINSFPTLDSGSIGKHYQLDPEVLDQPGEMRIQNLVVRRLLGIGGQGRVYLAQGPIGKLSESGQTKKQMVFAVKVIIKSRHVQYDDILREQKLLRRLRGNVFLLQLEASFHDRRNFYLVTEYHTGGDLDELLRVYGYFSAPAARVYAAELCAAVIFLHENYILHRDIKPSNILIKSDGHICLSDFGLAVDFLDYAIEDEDTILDSANPVIRGCAGTTMYMAPEALRGDCYGFKADWWSVGTTCYNIFEGIHPWPYSDYSWLVEYAGIEPVQFRATADNHVKSLIRALLQRDPEQRISDHELFAHSFFDGIKIQDVYDGRLVPPHIPKFIDPKRIRNTLTKNDVIEIGEHYSAGATPMPDYVFYGSKLPPYVPSLEETNKSNRPEGPCPPFKCTPSLNELLEMSFDAIESTRLNNGSEATFVPPPGHLDAISGFTLVEELGLDDDSIGDSGVSLPSEGVRKDSEFRWSMLGDEEMDDVVDNWDVRATSQDEVKIEARIEFVSQEEADERNSMSIPNAEPLEPSLEIKQEPRTMRQELILDQECGSTLGLKHRSQGIPATPAMSSTTSNLASPPSQKALHREAKLVVVELDDPIADFHIHTDIKALALSPSSGLDTKGISFETVTPSSLGLGGGGEGDDSGVTSIAFDISGSAEVGPAHCSNFSFRGDSAIGREPQVELFPTVGSVIHSSLSFIFGDFDHQNLRSPEIDQDDRGRNVNSRSLRGDGEDVESIRETDFTEGEEAAVSRQEQAGGDPLDAQKNLIRNATLVPRRGLRDIKTFTILERNYQLGDLLVFDEWDLALQNLSKERNQFC